MAKYYYTPSGQLFKVYMDMLAAGHTLIAGAQGSGKSTVLAGLIHTALYKSPAAAQFVIIDPKRVDMVEYKALPHTVCYATEPKQIVNALQLSINVMEDRYKTMTRMGLKEYDGSFLYIFIDEVADLMTDTANKRVYTPMIQRLAQLGRAAHITVIMATQCCLASVISTPIKCNFPSRLALQTATAQDSRNIIDVKGAEQLPSPRFAGKCEGLWRNGAALNRYDLPRYDDAERLRLIEYWKENRKPRGRFSLFGRKSA